MQNPVIREDLIFSLQWHSQRGMRWLLNYVFLLIVIPLLSTHIFKNFLLPNTQFMPILLIISALVITYIFYMILISSLFRISESSINQLRRKLFALGFLKESEETLFVSMSPGIQPRQITTGGSWDYGFLVITDTELRYIGDKIRFTLPKDSIHAIDLGRGLPSIAETRVVVVQWGKGDGEHVACRIAPQPAFYWQHEERRLCQRLKNWQREPPTLVSQEPSRIDEVRDLPHFSEIEGKTPREVAWLGFLSTCVFMFFVLIIGGVSGLARGALYAVIAPSLCLALLGVYLHATFKDSILPTSR
jgi:hypothetical protein